MTHGTIAGMLISDLICGKKNKWESVFSPSRKPIHEMKEFASHNINVGAQYTQWLKPSEVSKEEDIPFDSGAVINHGIHKVAVYRDEKGNFHRNSATCPHMKAVVHWNACEKTWYARLLLFY
jgi:hypothetical protein